MTRAGIVLPGLPGAAGAGGRSLGALNHRPYPLTVLEAEAQDRGVSGVPPLRHPRGRLPPSGVCWGLGQLRLRTPRLPGPSPAGARTSDRRTGRDDRLWWQRLGRGAPLGRPELTGALVLKELGENHCGQDRPGDTRRAEGSAGKAGVDGTVHEERGEWPQV